MRIRCNADGSIPLHEFSLMSQRLAKVNCLLPTTRHHILVMRVLRASNVRVVPGIHPSLVCPWFFRLALA